mmetsp:Transcript_4430/g.16178  ORF Transcript_4430/g.16178 Transcript_4430/m.16178 type:complete len:208 (+) Transcript_4430:2913-3536(+)
MPMRVVPIAAKAMRPVAVGRIEEPSHCERRKSTGSMERAPPLEGTSAMPTALHRRQTRRGRREPTRTAILMRSGLPLSMLQTVGTTWRYMRICSMMGICSRSLWGVKEETSSREKFACPAPMPMMARRERRKIIVSTLLTPSVTLPDRKEQSGPNTMTWKARERRRQPAAWERRPRSLAIRPPPRDTCAVSDAHCSTSQDTPSRFAS